ncbi:MAG: PAS domain S-box protein, partial [Deltaproteobacteria bacterium]|nr:PAS domain S-box protein [Deltaproteobacteria bacterium]
SYHHGDRWDDSVVQGVREMLGGREDVELAIEHLDLRRKMGEAYEQWVTNFLWGKYRNDKQDLIIVSDDAALDFLIRVRSGLFPDVPVVFCGINNFRPERIAGQEGMTGVNEAVSIEGTLNLGLALFPKTKRILVIADEQSAVSRANLNRYRAVVDRFTTRVEMVEWLDLTAAEALEELPKLTNNDLVLRLTTLLMPEGGYMPLWESMKLISQASPVPVLTLWDFDLGTGALGGMVVSGLEQGHKAGELALQILGGQPAAALPVIMDSPNVPMFDYAKMTRFGVDQDRLPAGAVVLDMPESIYARHKTLIWAVAAALTVMCLVIVYQVILLRVRKRGEAALRKSEARYRAYVDNAPLGIFLADQEGRYLSVNAEACRITGYSPEELPGMSITDLVDP